MTDKLDPIQLNSLVKSLFTLKHCKRGLGIGCHWIIALSRIEHYPGVGRGTLSFPLWLVLLVVGFEKYHRILYQAIQDPLDWAILL